MFALFQIVTSCGQLALVIKLNTEAMLTNESVTFTMFCGLICYEQPNMIMMATLQQKRHTHTYTYILTYVACDTGKTAEIGSELIPNAKIC